MSDATILEVRPLSYAIGAEVVGVDLTQPLRDDMIESVLDIWNEHHVLLFRGNQLSPRQVVAFAASFGTLDNHDATPFYRLDDVHELMQITNKTIGGKPSETRNTWSPIGIRIIPTLHVRLPRRCSIAVNVRQLAVTRCSATWFAPMKIVQMA